MKGKIEKRIQNITDKNKNVRGVNGSIGRGVGGECHETVLAGVADERQD
jgi:hypothetical protein